MRADRLMESLLDIRDDVAVARHFVVCLFMAAQASVPANERAALCAVSNAAREKLDVVERAVDRVIASSKTTGKR